MKYLCALDYILDVQNRMLHALLTNYRATRCKMQSNTHLVKLKHHTPHLQDTFLIWADQMAEKQCQHILCLHQKNIR